jgi:hypothetical protein
MWFARYAEVASFAAGTFLVLLALRNARAGLAARGWLRVPASIVRSFVLVHTDNEGAGYFPTVEYEYIMEGRKYSGNRLRYGQTGSSFRRQAERVIGPYPAGASVEVFVNPARPSEAVLVPGTSWGNAAIALAGVAFLSAGFMLAWH